MQLQATIERQVVSQGDLEALLVMFKTREALKKRLAGIDEAYKSLESRLIGQIESGAELQTSFDLEIKVSERRYPSWKSEFVRVAGEGAADQVLEQTAPTVTKSLIVR